MADVGLGQEIIATARRRSKLVRDAMSDSRPVTRAMKEHGGYLTWESGRSLVMPSLSDQNDSVDWVGETGQAPLTENNVLDGPEGSWYFLLGSMMMSKAEELKNRSPSQYVPLMKSKMQALEKTQKNKFHEGVLSSGTGSGGLQMSGLASFVSTTPTTGTVLGIDRANAAGDANWFRNQKFDTSGDWSDGAVDTGNVHRFLDKGIDATSLDDAEPNVQVGLLGATHWGCLTAATRPFQFVQTEKTSIKIGQNVIFYRGVPCYLSGGLNYSGFSAQTATRTYLLNVEEGGFNVIFMEGAEFEMLPKVQSSDQAVVSMLMFTMVSCMLGGYAKRCWVGFD